jgi:hypothetical protein
MGVPSLVALRRGAAIKARRVGLLRESVQDFHGGHDALMYRRGASGASRRGHGPIPAAMPRPSLGRRWRYSLCTRAANMVRFPDQWRISHMSIVDDLVSNLVERNTIRLNGTFTATLIDGGVAVKGHIFSTLRDQKKNKDLLNLDAPVNAEVRIGDIVIPLPRIP